MTERQKDRPWLMRTYAGHSTAEASNELYRRNLAKGQTGLSIAFDLPTQTGYDPDALLARGEVGKVGVPVPHLGAGERGVGVVAGLGRQVEGHRQAGLTLGEVGPVERVGRRGGGVAGVRAHHPGLVLGVAGLLDGHTTEGRPTPTDW